MGNWLLLALLAFTGPALGQGFFDDWFGGGDRLNRYTGIFAAPEGQRSLYNAPQWYGAAAAEYGACRAQYDSWFADGVMDISLVMGYHDRPGRSPRDQEDFAKVKELLTRSCWGVSNGLCEFSWVPNDLPDNITVLEKKIENYQGGAPFRIRVTLGYSSATLEDHSNVGPDGVISATQARFSNAAEEQFFGSLRAGTCEVCAYMGHARDGGGPDFRPVPLTWRDGRGAPIYSKYKRQRTNYRRLLESVQRSPVASRQLIAILGCASMDHFYAHKLCPVEAPGCQPVSLNDFAASKGFYLSDLLSWPQNRDQYLGLLLDGVVGLKCRSAVDRNTPKLRGLPRPEAYEFLGSFLQ